MGFQLSPGVNITEIDLTTVVPAVATSDGAFAGVFRWGPIGERVLIDSENLLVQRFGKPTNFNAETFFTAASFLSYANRLYVSRAADTDGSTPSVNTITSSSGNNIFTVSNTTGITVGMYISQTSNSTVVNATGLAVNVVAVNSSSFTLSKNAAASNSSLTLHFARPETAYTAVALDTASNSSAFVANLVNQIVKNQNDYTNIDGAFDSDVLYVAKYPGAMGNSLRIGVCDNSNSFSSNISVSNTTVNTAIEFRVGSNDGTIKFSGSSNASANAVAAGISIGDQILAGNSSISLQYLQVKSITVNATYVNTSTISFNGNTDVNSNLNFITISNNPYTNGDIVTYANAAGNSVVSGLTSGTNYYVVEANSSGIKLSVDSFGSVIDITSTASSNGSFIGNTNTLVVSFEDPYRLRTNYVSNTVQRNWEFFNVVETAPGQSNYVLFNGNTSANDELHVVIVDEDGLFTGTPGTILEVYKGISRATDSQNLDGSTNYYKDVINQNSNYIWWSNDRPTALSNTAANITSSSATAPLSINFTLGADGYDESGVSLGTLGSAYDMFASAEDVDISLIMQGKPIGGTTVVNGTTVQNYQLANYIIDNICEIRKDCVALVSPDKNLVLNAFGSEALNLSAWRGALHSTSYAVMDSGYKYMYDRYNDIYRWIPLNGDIAGVCVRTDNTNDAWWSPAGFNRGQIKNLVKLAYNPRKAERDILYKNGVNPVVTFPAQGTVLFGDKTLQAKPSAFDRINVRRLFIVLEKAISTAAKYSLFEFNDAFTRAQFKNLVVPYLRTIQGRRGITDFLVVCDDTNNTPQIIDSNQFVGDIYIKPARSINFIQLNFVAVATGVQFSEVVGRFG
jgi:phage tail sheath protein FI